MENLVGFMATLLIIAIPIIIFYIFCMWRIYAKAGKPGWAAIIPIYNDIVFLQIVKKPSWWLIWFLLPSFFAILNIATGRNPAIAVIFGVLDIVCYVYIIMTIHALSKAFGHGAGFTVGLILLFFIFIPLLAFGDSKYIYNEQEEALPTDYFTTQQPKS